MCRYRCSQITFIHNTCSSLPLIFTGGIPICLAWIHQRRFSFLGSCEFMRIFISRGYELRLWTVVNCSELRIKYNCQFANSQQFTPNKCSVLRDPSQTFALVGGWVGQWAVEIVFNLTVGLLTVFVGFSCFPHSHHKQKKDPKQSALPGMSRQLTLLYVLGSVVEVTQWDHHINQLYTTI